MWPSSLARTSKQGLHFQPDILVIIIVTCYCVDSLACAKHITFIFSVKPWNNLMTESSRDTFEFPKVYFLFSWAHVLWFPASFVLSWNHVTDLIHDGVRTETMKAIYGSAHKTSKTSCKCIIFSLFTYQRNEDFKESRGSQNGKIEA